MKEKEVKGQNSGTQSSPSKGLTRRDFLKGAAVVVGGGVLAGCGPREAAITPEAEATASAAGQAAPASQTGGYSFLTPPAPVPASEIKSQKSADVVVLGAGISGVCAAYAAAEAGAKVIVLEKRNTYTFHGGWNGVIGARLHKSQGIDIPKDELMADIMRFGAYHPNPRLIKLWLDEGGRVMDRLLDMADVAGMHYIVDTDAKEHWPYREFPLAVNFVPEMNSGLVPMIGENAKAKGVEFLFETPAVQLIREDGNGKVTGVIAKNAEGYIQVDAAKGVIICTGCYGNNKEMLAAYAPRALKAINNQYSEKSNTGDGILMGMWAGAAKQETSCPMLWDGMIPGGGIFVSIARQPWLYVNTLGERYANEDAPFGYTANQDIQQPGSQRWAVWDANWNADKDKFQGTVCEKMKPPFWTDQSYDDWMKKDVIVEANSLEELADKMEVPRDVFLASVKRYNELVEKGSDEDFGKDPAKLTAIKEAPFGASKVGTGLLVTLDGLRINTELQVLDTTGEPIPGLYAAGNASGDFFSNDYPITVIGSSHGRALTFGWLAGEKVTSS